MNLHSLRFTTFALSFFESQDYLDSVMSLVALDSIKPTKKQCIKGSKQF
ncbi:hypothetical protein [uncultured Helicobacter sp.]